MADYWKSGERHFCTFCKCWLAGNKISINLHESGNNHKNNVKAKLDQVRRDKVEKERQEKQFNSTLADIERAATVAYQRDIATEASGNGSTVEQNLPSKLKRPLNQPVQVQCKKAKFVLKTPATKPVFVPISTEKKVEEEAEKPAPPPPPPPTTTTTTDVPEGGTWYESKTENQESYFWNDTTGETSWTPPDAYLSIEEQREKGIKV